MAVVGMIGFATLSLNSNAASGTFTTSGGTGTGKTWNATLNSSHVGAAFYMLNGYANQGQEYVYDELSMDLVLYCFDDSNRRSLVEESNKCEISASANAGDTYTSGQGTVYVEVSDSYYGSGHIRLYN
ncbi:MAG: hypothetical protein IJA32_03215 [Lachnospiraceae bacterium]|nr:hypothetical protein [Lachnospiraceae bacterium]